MCQAAGEWHLVGITSWRKGCSAIGKRPRIYDRVIKQLPGLLTL